MSTCVRKYFRDVNRSILSSKEIEKFRGEIVRQQGSPVCPRQSTMKLVDIGAKAMNSDDFHLANGHVDV